MHVLSKSVNNNAIQSKIYSSVLLYELKKHGKSYIFKPIKRYPVCNEVTPNFSLP